MKWEYKIVVRGRDLTRPHLGSVLGKTSADNTIVFNDFTPSGDEMLTVLQSLGQEEWELVGISTRASQLNSPMTTEEIWVFKRPTT